jgi:hypothetical protein
MNDDTYIYEAIDIVPPVTEAEIQARLATGDYQKVTWEDQRRIGDGYFARVGEGGMIGLAMYPVADADETHYEGIAIQVNPLEDKHQDATIEAELRKMVEDFGSSPDGSPRQFGRFLCVEKNDREYRVFVRDGEVVREAFE